MKNKELLNICYKFLNRFIIVNELIEKLNNMDKSNFDKDSIEKTDKLIKELKEIATNTPNEVDEYVVKKKEQIEEMRNKIMEEIDKISNKDNISFFERELKNLNKQLNKEMDSQERWLKIRNCIVQNDYFNKCFDSLTDYELLEFIAQYIKAPSPPILTQEKFEKLVKVGIENDKREWLWRLAFHYENKNINFDCIVNYFIKVKDGYYISELISAVGECLDIDNIINKINDKELIEDLKSRREVIISFISDEQFNKLINKLN